MSGPKKFGTFSGVFTPAILTILGVIMYLRLPWIVGQAGLYMTIGIIVVAHVISITTGLSVSSISTDKRVKTGGTYYMISRSLGLPIGGTLGLALYVGLSFSVSLYLIGFSESFLGFCGFEVTKNSIRLTGSIALVAVTIITLISTSLALKTQFFILLAIALSLGSIFLGKPIEMQTETLLYPIAGSASFIVLFGIFFPAVTGFEAGVSMSGDLKNAKKSIPIGTIGAIFFGMAVYIGMAVYFSKRVSSDQLINNSNVLLDISLFSPIVLAGIWGATVSSALGSILGAPRILQAISIDKITPRVFGRGYGKENEPRNALLLTFFIAEAGILVGELDVIARVVSMFFITTYGFLNMSCAIENWASPDFRPDLKIPKMVSIVGAVTCLVVMIQLDLLAMVGASVLLGSLFFYLKKKELTLESGDTWEGVWSSVIREGLNRLNRNKGQQRNWRPNIILFSGGASVRPHLMDLGKRLVYKRGILSNFNLVETTGPKIVYRKSEQSVKLDDEEFEGIFTRRVECEDVYSAMETISKYYGFSGLEPNTVLMGWGKNSHKPEKFVHLIQSISDLDYNLMVLRFDEVKGFGDHRRIDIWWRGMGNCTAFAFSLCRFLTSSDEWRHAEIRFLIITEDSSVTEKLFENMNQIVLDYRIDAIVKVINNAVEQKPFYDIMKRESKDADLIINGIPNIKKGEELLYVTKTNSVIEQLGTVLLIKASSFFSEINIGVDQQIMIPVTGAADKHRPKTESDLIQTGDLSEGSVNAVRRIESLISTVNHNFEKNYLGKILSTTNQWIEDFKSLVLNTYSTIEKNFIEDEYLRNHRLLLTAVGDFLFKSQKLMSEKSESRRLTQMELLEDGLKWVLSHVETISGGIPERVKTTRSKDVLRLLNSDSMTIKILKLGKRFQGWITRKPVTGTVRFRELADQYLTVDFYKSWLSILQGFTLNSLKVYPELQRAIDHVVDSFGKVGTRLLAESEQTFEFLIMERERIEKELNTISVLIHSRFNDIMALNASESRRIPEKLVADISRFDSHSGRLPDRKIKHLKSALIEKVEEIPIIWETNHSIMLKTTQVDLTILSFRNRITTIVRRAKGDMWLKVQNSFLDRLNDLSDHLEKSSTASVSSEPKQPFTVSFKDGVRLDENWRELVEEIRTALDNLPESMESVQQDSIQQVSGDILQPFQKTTLSFRRMMAFYFESEFIGPVDEKMDQVADDINRAVSIAQDVVRLVSLNLNELKKLDEQVTASEKYPLERIISDAMSRVDEIRKSVTLLRQNLDQAIDTRLKSTFENLNLYSLVGIEDSRKQQLSEKRELKWIVALKTGIEKLSQRITDLSILLLYRHTSITTDLQADESVRLSRVSAVDLFLEMVESATPRSEVVTALPFYYRHLFLGKPSITKEFWVGRQKELQRAGKAVKRFQSGFKGGLAVIGEPGSGKSVLSQFIAARYFDRHKVFVLTPPDEGSVDLRQFESRLQDVFGKKESIDDLFRHLLPNSALILDDIARWWERGENGFSAIDRMMELIQQYGDRCFFIVNLNTHTYQFINRIREIENRFLDVIRCAPFDIPSLKQIIMLRHRSTGLRFICYKSYEVDLNEWQMARIFTRHLKSCHGNVGLALIQWVRGISQVTKDELTINCPVDINEELFSNLKPDQVIVLIQFLLHGSLNRYRLENMMRMSSKNLSEEIHALKRSGLLLEKTADIYQINPYIQPYLLRYVKQKGLL